MNQKLFYPIFSSYFKNSSFRLASILVLAGLIQAYVCSPLHNMANFQISQNWLIDILSWMLVLCTSGIATVFWPVIFGFILKSQFAHPRATVLPEFRLSHLCVAFFLYASYLLIMFLSRANILTFFSINIPAATYFIILGFCSIVIIWFSYIYHQMFWNYIWLLYLILYFLGARLKSLNPEILLNLALLSFPLLVVGLGIRLMRLNEDMYEYNKIFSSLETKDYSKAKVQSGEFYLDKWKKLTTFLHIQEKKFHVEQYPRGENFWSRAAHWRKYIFGPIRNIWWVGLMFGVWMTFIEYKHGGKHTPNYFFTFFLPYMMVWSQIIFRGGEKNRKMSLGLDLLKPLRRENFIQEVGLAVLLQSLGYCLIFFFCFEVLGKLVLSPLSLFTSEMGNYLVLTFCLQIVIFAVTACLTKFMTSWKNIFFIIWIAFMVPIFLPLFGVETAEYPKMTIDMFALVFGFLLSQIAWRLWYFTEFN